MTQPIDIRTRRVIGHKEGPKVYRSDNLRAPSAAEAFLASRNNYRMEPFRVREITVPVRGRK